jgi:YbbR domain-containing protein
MKLRWKEFTVALLMAIVLWYGVSGSEKLESHLEVRMDYRGLPQGMVVRSGLVSKVSVRVRAPVGMLRTLTNREYAFDLDLSHVHKGQNILPVSMAHLPFRVGVEVIEISPSRIFLDVDTISSRILPLEAQVNTAPPRDHALRVAFNPPEVRVSGPSSLVDEMTMIEVQIVLEKPDQIGDITFTRMLPLPHGIDASPPEAKVTVSIDINRTPVKVTRNVQVTGPPDKSIQPVSQPERVSIEVAMPESLAARAASNKDIQAFARFTDQGPGSHTLPVQVELPAGAELIAVDPPHITVTLEQK